MMKIDLYTRGLLTVIAVALLGILVQNQVLIARSQSPQATLSRTVATAPTSAAIPVANPIGNAVRIPQTADNTVYVYLKDFQDELDINLDELGGRSISNSLPVTEKDY